MRFSFGNGMKKALTNTKKVMIVLTLIMAALSGFLLREEVEEHTVAAYDAAEYTNLEHLNRLLLQTKNICKTGKDKEYSAACNIMLESIMDHATLHDLAAQETVALATRGLLRVGGYQAFASLATLAFLIWTVSISRDMSKEATKTARAANNALEIARQSATSELMPYLSIVTASPPPVQISSESTEFIIILTVRNYGRTPARRFRNIRFNAPRSGSDMTVRFNGGAHNLPITTSEEGPMGPNDTTLELLNPDEKETMWGSARVTIPANIAEVLPEQFMANCVDYLIYGSFEFDDFDSFSEKLNRIVPRTRRCEFVINGGSLESPATTASGPGVRILSDRVIN